MPSCRRLTIVLIAIVLPSFALTAPLHADDLHLKLRFQRQIEADGSPFTRVTRDETWPADQTAVIVCDVWDYHHSLNAVRRLEEFAPRLNEVLKAARGRGATIIHSPSDCMAAYADHPARKRALDVPVADPLPDDIRHWVLRIPSEERAAYPIDQTDGGDDDDPQEHAAWSAKLAAMGRNTGTPWLAQSPLITIDEQTDYISDRGDEVWSILKQRGITHVILTGVHVNMCVLGRPFGLRQMARNGMSVVLMRDLTDSMYNPKRWPHVDHFTGHDLVISHVERYVCPTITSDQLLGGNPFRWKADQRGTVDVMQVATGKAKTAADFENDWSVISVPNDWKDATGGVLEDYQGFAWYRCTVRMPTAWKGREDLTLQVAMSAVDCQAWLNGKVLPSDQGTDGARFKIPANVVEPDDANLLVVCLKHKRGDGGLRLAPAIVVAQASRLPLEGRWQFRLGHDASWSSLPLPAKFATPTDIVFEALPP